MTLQIPVSCGMVAGWFLLLWASHCRGELFTALIDLSRSLDAEVNISNDLLQYVLDEEARLVRIRQLATELTNHGSASQSEDPERYISNPVNAYLMIKRFPFHWRQQLDALVKEQADAQDELNKRLATHETLLPNREDLTGAADALIRLQDTYKLSTHTIAKGRIHPNSTSPELTAAQCFSLGEHAYTRLDFYHTRLWMQQALSILDEESRSGLGLPTISRVEVLEYLAFALYKQGKLREALSFTNELLTLEPNHTNAQSNRVYYEERIAAERAPGQERRGDEGDMANDDTVAHVRPSNRFGTREFGNYEALCRGESLETKPKHPQSQVYQPLYCRYYVPHAVYLIGPIKEEVFYIKPRIVMWYKVIHDSEIDRIKSLAAPRLNRATVQNSVTGKLEYATYRISKSAWLRHDLDEITVKMDERIAALTGLNVETAEELQVVNYGLGGHYEPHFDFARKHEKHAFEDEVGNRVSTLLFYLSDVLAGGATVFTELGARITPVRGAAAFWWNLLPSGDGDLTTRHAACPVLTGSKWVMNKWFHERGQEFRRPCTRDRASSHVRLSTLWRGV